MNIDILRYFFGYLNIRIAHFLVSLKQLLVFYIQKMSDLFHNSYSVRFFFRMLPNRNQQLKKLIDIGKVKITGYCQITGFPIVLSKERVNRFNGVFTKSTVPNMTKEKFTGKWKILLQPFRIL